MILKYTHSIRFSKCYEHLEQGVTNSLRLWYTYNTYWVYLLNIVCKLLTTNNNSLGQ